MMIMKLTRRNLLITVSLTALCGVLVFLFVIVTAPDLKTRALPVKVGMSRAQVVAILGKPVLDMNRTEDRGTMMVWVDQFWQLDIVFGREGIIESVNYSDSDSFYNSTIRGKWFSPK